MLYYAMKKAPKGIIIVIGWEIKYMRVVEKWLSLMKTLGSILIVL